MEIKVGRESIVDETLKSKIENKKGCTSQIILVLTYIYIILNSSCICQGQKLMAGTSGT
jgi:hypothetical protein